MCILVFYIYDIMSGVCWSRVVDDDEGCTYCSGVTIVKSIEWKHARFPLSSTFSYTCTARPHSISYNVDCCGAAGYTWFTKSLQ